MIFDPPCLIRSISLLAVFAYVSAPILNRKAVNVASLRPSIVKSFGDGCQKFKREIGSPSSRPQLRRAAPKMHGIKVLLVFSPIAYPFIYNDALWIQILLCECAAGRSPEDVVVTRVAAPKAVINGTALLPGGCGVMVDSGHCCCGAAHHMIHCGYNTSGCWPGGGHRCPAPGCGNMVPSGNCCCSPCCHQRHC
ncbi:hypothetical protein BKA93DRAFT_201813 [Sparassis latifolia]